MKGTPPSIVISEGTNNLAQTDSADQTMTVSGSDIPIDKWRQYQAVDLLIACSQSEFKLYFNGKYIKSVPYWHDVTDGSTPSIWNARTRIQSSVDDGKITKFSWTYGKIK